MIKQKKRSFLLFFLFTSTVLFATDYYVAKDGDDANPGTEAAPFLTISKVDWAVISASGQIRSSNSLPFLAAGNQQIEIDVRALPAGSYFVVGQTDAGGFAQRLIVE